MRGRRWRVRAAKALIFLLVLWLPLAAVAPSANAAPLRVPSRAQIRSGLEDLWAWLTGKHQPAPVTPVQQSGTAAGHPHQVPAAVSQAVARATGRAPGAGLGQLPAYRPHVPAVREDTTRPAPGAARFNAKTSKLVAAAATSDMYRNADGSYTRNVYAGPVNYQARSGAWLPIATTLVPAAGGRWADRANSLSVSFAPRANDRALVSLTPGADGTGSFGISFGLAGAAGVRGTTAGPTVTYRGVLADTDLAESDTSTGIAERLVLHSATAPSTWIFPLTLTGLTPHMRADGSIWLTGAHGAVRGVIPAGLAQDSATGPRTGPIGATTPVKYELVTYQGGLALRASIDPAWLASPSRVFPVVVDPSYNATTTGSTEAMYPFTNDYSGNTLLQVGNDGAGQYARSFLAFNGLGSALADEHITGASLHVWDAWAWTCGTDEPFGADAISVSWSVTGNKSWPGPATGPAMFASDTEAPSAACTNTSGNPSVGGWMNMPLDPNGLGLQVLNNWTLHPSDDYGIALTNSTTDDTQWKQFDSFNTVNAPYLSLTYSADVPPQINSEYPPDNYSSPSLTPELLASGSDPDSWPGALQYLFTVYSTAGAKIASSGLISTGDWTVPKGDLSWGQEYYWTVQDYDGLDYSAAPDINYFGTPVPQPLITSGLSQNDTGPGFDAASGNWTTSATDAQISTVGPALAVQRDYNSFDPRTAGAFGAGWSSVLDMQVSPGQTDSSGATTTEDVTYPDGEQVGFGLNSDGKTYTAPPGRYATLTPVSSGGFTLTDKNDTVYTFTQSLSGGVYGITSITDALGHALTFTWNSLNEITTMTSASGRALHLTWTSPSAGSGVSPHVAHVFTDPVTGTDQNTDLTWQYSYTGDQLTSVCPPISSTSCSAYTYESGSGYPNAVLDSGPNSYWRLDETSGTTAASSVLVNEGTDNGTYSAGVTLGAPGPLTGSSATSAAFNGSSSSVTLPPSLQLGAAYQSVSLWFKTTTPNGVLYSYQDAALSAGSTTSNYVPAMYVGSDGKLNAEILNGKSPITTSSRVTDGNWHLATLSVAGNTETLYLDGAPVGSVSGNVDVLNLSNHYVGSGFIGGSWPDESHSGVSAATPLYFNGDISDFAFWTRPVTATEVAAMYAAGTHAAALATTVTRPSGKVYAQVGYNPLTAAVTSVTDSNGGTWAVGAPSVTGSSQVYASSVLGADPAGYWRLTDTGTADAVNQVKGGTAVYSSITQGVTGGPFSDATVDSLNGTSSYIQLPAAPMTASGDQSVSLWFKTSTANEVLYSYQATPVSAGSTTSDYVPALYIGSDGKLNGEFWPGGQIKTSSAVDDGKWHEVVLASAGTSQTMYLDGAEVGTAGGVTVLRVAYDYVGTGFIGGSWADESHSGDTPATPLYFKGDLAEVAVYPGALTAAQVTDQWQASKYSSGLTPVENVSVTDPGGKTLAYQYDPLNGDRILTQTDALGNTTKYGYDTNGFLNTVTDPDGDVTITGHDIRGNLVSQTTCQAQSAQKCSTDYYSYYPDDTSASPPADPRNDMLLTARDGRSSSASDNTYLTTYTYDSKGDLTAETTPPVPGFLSGRSTSYAYTNGTTATGGYQGAVPPAGLPYQEITPGGAITSTLYYGDGDVAQVTDPDGQVTQYTYDGIGRVLSKTVISDSYPSGLVTSYTYNQMGQVVTETDPPVTDRVTGAVHTAQITTTYDADGNVLTQTAADTTGGDAPRTVSYTYDSHDLKASSTDAAGAVTKYTYDAYGDLATQTDPSGNVTSYVYDADGRLDTVTLDNYTGDPANPSAPVNLVESSRAYDPAGRMVSITDSMGNATLYSYTDNGLVAQILRTSPSGPEFVEQLNTYDAAGNLITQVTNNLATTTDYTVDAADRVTSQTLDPSGLDRVTNVTYSPDNQVITQSLSGSAGTPARVTDLTYDGMGNETSQSVHDDTAAQAPAGWWPLTDGTGTPAGYYPTIAADDSGNGSPATRSSGVTWNSGSASFNGTSGSFTTSGPVVNTTDSFTVAAWVNLAGDTSSSQTVVSQDAGTDAGFYLKYYPTTGTWQFMRPLTDTTNAATASANSNSPAVTGTWTFLTGTYSAGTGAVTLYVNGAAASNTGTDTTPIAAGGPLAIGRAKWDGSNGDWVDGQIANVQVYPYALSGTQVSSLYNAGMGGAPVGENRLTTKWTLDERGLPTSMTDPDGDVTHYSYDEAGRLAVTTQPTITTQVHGGSATATAPVTMTGYDTFGEPVESSDANGNVTATGYDADGRAVSVTAPPYTPPGSSPITARTSTTYNSLGQVTAETDPLGKQTTYTYDQLGDVATVTAPNDGVTHYTYDTNGDQLSVTGPTGAQTQSTYDFMGRKVTSTQLERFPSTAANTTDYAYGTGGWLSSSTSPDGVSTSYAYDPAGETVSVTDGAGNKTGYGYDVAGDRTSLTYPDGTQTTYTYDEAGRQTGSADLSAAGTTLRSDSAAYDSNGNLTASTDYRGDTTSYAYNAAGEMTQEVQPVTATSGISTSFGYDAAGNQTLYTDGDGNQWWTTYNSWNLPESKIEPTTAAYPTVAQSTFTAAYDADGRPVTLTEPGGVSVSDSYDSMGDLTGQSGSGASAATATRSFGYDLAGNMTSASTSSTAPQSQLPNATSESFTYDDQGLLLTASGSAGSSAFAYNGDGQETSATTAAGTASYSYDNDDRLASMSDPATGTTLTYSYNSLSQLSQISYGTGADSRAFGYNSLHELTSDTLDTSSGQTAASISYGYDANGNLTSKTTSSAFTGSAANTYTYDEANRLTSWNNGTTTTDYGYDGAGNLTQAGAKTYTYDARDELTNDGTNAYSYTANGTLASEATPSGTASFTADAYGQQVTEGTQSYLYDALARDLQVTSGPGGVTPLSYQGASDLLTSDGADTYTWTPDGTLTGTGVAGGSASQGRLDYTDQHTDVVGQFTASGTSLSGSAGYDPWGNLVGSSLTGSLGYQSQFTDPVTGKVQMGARFYNPGTGGFQDKDTATVKPVPDSAAANPFAYAADNPLGGTDPTGHMLCEGGVCGSAQFLDRHFAAAQAAAAACNAACQAAQQQAAYWASQAAAAAQQAQQARQQESSCGGWTSWFSPSCDMHRVESFVRAAVHYAMQASEMVAKYTAEAARLAVKDTSTAVDDAAEWGAHGARAAWHTVQQAGSRAYNDAATWAKEGYEATTHAVSTAYHYVAKAATATAHFVVHHAATIASVAVSVAAFAGCEAVTAGAGTIGCAAIAGAAGNAVSYAITAAQTGHFSWSGLGEAALTGAVVGALSGGLAEGASSLLSGVAGTLLRSGAEEASDALATSATEEAVSSTTDSAATTADATSSAAAEDASARAGAAADEGGEGAEDASGSCEAGGESFTAYTKVLTASGALVAISKLATGEKVLAANTKTGKNQAEPVAAVLVHHDTDLYDLKVRSGGVTSVIDTTSNHLFWVPGTHRWVKAAALRYGTHLRTPEGTDAVVTGGYIPRDHDGWMWDLTVTSDHDFYISGGVPVLVHNCGESAEEDAQAAAARADEIQKVHLTAGAEPDTIAFEMRTTSVVNTDGPSVVASGGRDLTSDQIDSMSNDEVASIMPDEHAEVTGITGAVKSGLTPRSIGASRDFCDLCQLLIEETGGTITSSRTAVWDEFGRLPEPAEEP